MILFAVIQAGFSYLGKRPMGDGNHLPCFHKEGGIILDETHVVHVHDVGLMGRNKVLISQQRPHPVLKGNAQSFRLDGFSVHTIERDMVFAIFHNRYRVQGEDA